MTPFTKSDRTGERGSGCGGAAGELAATGRSGQNPAGDRPENLEKWLDPRHRGRHWRAFGGQDRQAADLTIAVRVAVGVDMGEDREQGRHQPAEQAERQEAAERAARWRARAFRPGGGGRR